MKTLLITDNFLPHSGGSRVIFYNLCANLEPAEISVLTRDIPGCGEFDRMQEFKIYRCRLKEWPWKWTKIYELPVYFKLFIRAFHIILKEKIDLLQCGEVLPSGLVGYLLRLLTRRPYIVYTFAEEVNMLSPLNTESKVARFVLNKADCVIATCTYVQGLLEAWGVSPQRIVKMLPAVEESFFASQPGSIEDLRKELGLEGKKVVLTVARLVERKGHDKVIQALPKVINEVPGLIYVIIGSGPQEESLKGLVARMGLSDYVRFLGDLPHHSTRLIDYYRACDVFIMANRQLPDADTEGFGVVFAEAGALAKPVIGGISGGTGDVIRQGVNGLRIDGRDSGQIALALIQLLKDGQYARRLGEAGRMMMEREFRYAQRIKFIREIYRQMILNRGSRR